MSPHVHDRLSAYLDGEISAVERAGVEEHLRECAECTGRLGDLAAVDERARALSVEAPAGYFDTFASRVRRRLEGRARRWELPVWTLAAAAALILAVVTPLTFQQRPVPPQATPAAEAPPPAPEAAASTETRAPYSGPEKPSFAAPPATLPDQVSRARAPADEKAREADRGLASVPEATRSEAGPADAPRSAGLADKLRKQAAPPPAPAAPPPPAAAAPEPQRAFATEPPAPGEGYGVADSVDVDAAKRDVAGAEEERARRKNEGRLAAAGSRTGTVAGKKATLDGVYRDLLARTPRTAAEARALRESWLAFARENASAPRADEARVRAIEAALAAWRLGRDDADLAAARRDAAAYLERPDAAQAARVRALLADLPPRP